MENKVHKDKGAWSVREVAQHMYKRGMPNINMVCEYNGYKYAMEVRMIEISSYRSLPEEHWQVEWTAEKEPTP